MENRIQGKRVQRCMRTLVALLVVGAVGYAPGAAAIPAPSVDPTQVPGDGQPGPEQPMHQSNLCAKAIAVAEPNVGLPAPGFVALNVADAWKYSTGNGVPVAVIDTGVSPSPRLPVVPGGDYIMGGDGLSDCDAHGTVVASVIAAAPQGSPMPAPMPRTPAFDARVAVPVATPPVPVGAPDGPPGAADGVVGVAPHAVVISIRQSSRAFEPERPAEGDAEAHKKAGSVATLARAIVHAANIGAKVINISVTACISAADPLDQRALGAAVWYASTVKDAVIVAAAGNAGEDGCVQNPAFNPLAVSDAGRWDAVKTVSSPSWYSDYVLSVGAVDISGAPIDKSLAGPWVAVAAPGVDIMGLSPETGGPVNAYPPVRPGEQNVPFWGTSFSAAYVSGVVALVRAKFPGLTAHQVIHRILQTAHNPPRGVDTRIGYGMVDPVAALTFDVAPGERQAPGAQTRVLTAPPPPSQPDHRARNMALGFAAVLVGGALCTALVNRARQTIR